MFETKSQLWHLQLTNMLWGDMWRILLWRLEISPNIEFVPSKQQNLVFWGSISHSFKIFTSSSRRTADFVDGTSNKARCSITNSRSSSLYQLKNIPIISFLGTLIASSANITTSEAFLSFVSVSVLINSFKEEIEESAVAWLLYVVIFGQFPKYCFLRGSSRSKARKCRSAGYSFCMLHGDFVLIAAHHHRVSDWHGDGDWHVQ